MKKNLFFLYTFIGLQLIAPSLLKAQESTTNWQVKFEDSKSFIENKGQFDVFNCPINSEILFAYDREDVKIFFTKEGVSYYIDERIRNRDKKKGDVSKPNFYIKKEWVHMKWLGSSADVILVGEEEGSDKHIYASKSKSGIIDNVKGFKKIVYKNLYPNIDIEYIIHPESGIKYSAILNPGADLSQLKFKYDNHSARIDEQGNLKVKTIIGDITEHKPISFYAGNTKEIIPSAFQLNSDNTVSFAIPSYRNGNKFIIDPWVETPTLASSNCVWECEKDGAGNVYIIGGDKPMKVQKYNPSGVLQWTYNTPWDTTDGRWLGTIATDLNGNSFVTNGAVAEMQRINTNGTMDWYQQAGFLSTDEYWSISFNCDQSKLIVGGTKGAPFPSIDYRGAIFDINTSNGAILGSVNVVNSTRSITVSIPPFPSITTSFPNEVRAISSSRNGKYYYLTHDTIGAINQDITACSSTPIFGINSTYEFSYKSEDWRPLITDSDGNRSGNSGICAIKANEKFVYTQNGTTVHKRSPVNGAILASATIPGGVSTPAQFTTPTVNQPGNSGIDIDDCGNVYVGSSNAIIKYDADLNLITSVSVPFKVFDVTVSYNGNVIICGATGTSETTSRTGYIQSINMNACSPFTLICCDATICPETSPVCQTDPAFNLQTAQTGGTWSGPGIDASGSFNPASAGPGVHTIVYTLPCGSDSISISVTSCLPIDVCVETNGDLTANGAVAPITWEYWQPAQTVSTNTQAQCQACGYTWSFGSCLDGFFPAPTSCTLPAQWVVYATGQTVSPPPNFPIRVSDGIGDFVEINSINDIPECSSVTCPTITVSVTAQNNVSCNGGNDGSATVSASGGNGAITYTWQPGNLSGATQNNLTAGTYTVTATDIDGCTGSTTVNITQPTAIQFTTSSTASACNVNNGTATINASGGSGTYTYTWNPNVSSGSTATGLAPGNYAVTVNDGNCQVNTSITVDASVPPVINNISATAETCLGDNNGTATVNASGGTGTLTFSWSNGASASSISGLTPGSYSVTVTDANGCTATSTVSVDEGPVCCELDVTVATIAPNCNTADGAINLTILSGSGNYSYVWSTGATSQNLTSIGSGSYSVTVTDLDVPGGICTFDTTVLLNDLNGPSIDNISSLAETCLGANDGSVSVVASGGTGTLSYLWSNGANTANVSSLAPGSYSVTVTDQSGCNATASVSVGQGPDCCTFTIAFSTISSTCNNSDGGANLTINNGSGNYSFAWSTGAITQNLSGVAAGTYSVTVTDNGVPGICQKDTTITINDADGPVIDNIISTNETCAGDSDGTVSVSASGGTGLLTYIWQPGNLSGASQTGLAPGNYTVTVRDANNCESLASVTVAAGPVCCDFDFVVTATNESCSGLQNGTAEVSIAGGVAPYTVEWNGTPGNNNIENLAPGTYTVAVTDADNCTETQTFEILEGPLVEVFAGNDTSIFVGTQLQLNAEVSNGTSGTYVWSPSADLSCENCQSPVATPSVDVVYTVVYNDNAGCSATDDVAVTVIRDQPFCLFPDAFTPNNDNVNDLFVGICQGVSFAEMRIYNRWGELVYQETGVDLNGWNGIYKGKNAPGEVYVYYVYVEFTNGDSNSYMGNVTLIR
jgi:gliding motility-associated-like protein